MRQRRIKDIKGIILFCVFVAVVLLFVFSLFMAALWSAVGRDLRGLDEAPVLVASTMPIANAATPSRDVAPDNELEAAPAAPAQEPAPAVEREVPSTTTAEALPWAEQMTTAGIAESDQSIVRALVFTGYDWNVRSCACYRNVRGLSSAESRFRYLDLYVHREHGSWTAAQSSASEGRW